MPTVFFSWQSDTPNSEGRSFIERALEKAAKTIGQDTGVEPAVRNVQVDSDTKGVSGSPPIVDTIFAKIDSAAVFVPDLTFVGTRADGAPTPNPNVLIEYGWALKSLRHARIVPLMNTAFGAPTSETMPFDMAHLRRPMTYHCPANADDATRKSVRDRLTKELEVAIRLVLESEEFRQSIPKPLAFPETPFTTTRAVFHQPGEVIARVSAGRPDEIEYRFDESCAFYLRLIPTTMPPPKLSLAQLDHFVSRRYLDVLSRVLRAGHPDRNRYGSIAFEPHGTATIPNSYSQAFPNGELWAVSSNFFVRNQGRDIIPTTNVEIAFDKVLSNFIEFSRALKVAPPYTVELGAVGLAGRHLGLRYSLSAPILESGPIYVRRSLANADDTSMREVIKAFMDELYDHAAIIPGQPIE